MEKKTGLRRLKHSELTVFREQAMKRIQSGVSVEEVCKGMGVSRSALFGRLARYRNAGVRERSMPVNWEDASRNWMVIS